MRGRGSTQPPAVSGARVSCLSEDLPGRPNCVPVRGWTLRLSGLFPAPDYPGAVYSLQAADDGSGTWLRTFPTATLLIWVSFSSVLNKLILFVQKIKRFSHVIN